MLVAGCASAPKPATTGGAANVWAGRMALQVQDKPAESFSAGFELRGTARAGELTLYTPLGGSLAVLSWQPGQATMRSGGQVRQFDSADALIAQATGSPVPLAALFDWLSGRDTNVPGWRADLSRLNDGRVAAQRFNPLPQADLRIVLER
ncbi:outer membrane lipoprotein LolB [Caenimonas koreensis DSM 17982]|uniref:Outer-membrane lipoprotein LolB n=2 Tax=Caenimonas TaxID=763439 RepID=A0A844B9V9_9BURK|nr:outer membrane lipoprotein LolB [Caenimonas koreensis DSM 17982]